MEVDDQSDSGPLVGPLVSPSTLLPSYENASLPGFTADQLLQAHSLEATKTTAIEELGRVKTAVIKSREDLLALGYSEIAFETFYDMFIELLDDLFTKSRDEILQLFSEEGGNSDYYTWYMRLITSVSMKLDVDRYIPFIDLPDIDAFCKSEVEPMGKECEQPQIIALTTYLGIEVRIEYLDGKPFEEEKGLSHMKFPDPDSNSSFAPVVLLYRPGHYDILIH